MYVSVVPNPRLLRVHRDLCERISEHASGVVEYYEPERWTPHITLAHHGLTADELPLVLDSLRREDFHWRIEIDNVAFIHDTNRERNLRRFEFVDA